MTEKIKLCVLFGGRSGEHEVSLMSARSVLSVLDPAKYEVIQVGITHEGRWLGGEDVISAFEKADFTSLFPVVIKPEPGDNTLYAIRDAKLEPYASLDVIFPVLHGSYGEDGTLQGFFEMADLAYIGAGVLGSSVAMDKALFKEVMHNRNIPLVDSILATRIQIEKEMPAIIDQAEKMSGYPLFVKPANLGSSVGVTKCRNRSDLQEGLLDAAQYDRRILIEHGVNAREIEVSVLGNDDPKASVAGEILPSRDFYSYEAKYLDNASGLLIPAPIDLAVMERVRKYAIEAFLAADCSGMARADFFLDKDSGELFLNEINTIPGFTQISMYPKLWDASGLPYPALIDRLVELALERKADRDRTLRTYRRAA